jgi:hypothetical protein
MFRACGANVPKVEGCGKNWRVEIVDVKSLADGAAKKMTNA